MPLIAPSSAPLTSVAATAAGTGHLRMCMNISAQKFVSANIDPTDRSMPPTIITSAMPSTMNPISPAWRRLSASMVAL